MDKWLAKAMATAASKEATQAFLVDHEKSYGFLFARPTNYETLLQNGDAVGAVRRIAIVQGLIEAFSPISIRREAETIVATTNTAEQALHLGLTLSQFREAHPVSIAVSGGTVLEGSSGDVHGLCVQQARKLVHWARPHELLVPRKVLDGFGLPQGVGIFAAPEVLEEDLGFSCAILRDFRTATPVN